MSQPPALDIRSLRYAIGGATIIDDVTFSVAPGEMLGVIGPNGAGKTTLFNLISGIAVASSGTITLDGADVTSAPVHRRARAGLGRTFQTSSLFPALSVAENVRLAAQARLGGALSVVRAPRDSDAASGVAAERLAEVGLAHHAATTAGVLSHGDKRKLEIAMLLAADPAVILLDEPMAGVASGDVAGLGQVIRDVHRAGRTVLMVEHHLDVLLGLVDRVAVMHHGRLLAIGEPSEVVADPAVQAAYLGEAV
ncbi:ABC transporter ATP-binding protein [Protaetiibacter mangrovi]|uniref:ABC transporter ATP-binding protein n=1 Tax=Protaetiibacter mangrovi TaxID=2970926 RepID=A0ABT1ZJ65_9MICO|nr:ABC transporter ATP-binding protein [Protaetiibacter mangrovi]MCS0500723.1 ABC transporter ATP-binding protein [Protaetiibacter mangrovi]TPX03540.1 ABC transporter ATP-binding protein [Schumannella luteola]